MSIPGMGAAITAKPQPVPVALGAMVTMTERAAAKAKSLLEAKGYPDGLLRVFVVGGGCSGYQYGMAIAPQAEADDQVVVLDGGVNVVIDRESVQMISGAEIDFVEDLMKSGFTIYNPNAVSACACGSSFQTGSNPGTPRPC